MSYDLLGLFCGVFGGQPFYYPGTKDIHTSPKRQRGVAAPRAGAWGLWTPRWCDYLCCRGNTHGSD